MASLKDVARLASVSLMTVSRAINNPELLKPETLRQVQQAIDALNYVPDFSARKIRGKNTKLSGLGVLAFGTDITPFSVDILLAIEQCARKYGWNSFVVNVSAKDDPARAVRQILALRPDGIIMATMALQELTVPESLLDKNVVLSNCVDPMHPSVPAYIPDEYQGRYQATGELIARGYRRPLCLWSTAEPMTSALHRDAVNDVWQLAGLPADDIIHTELPADDDHYRSVAGIITQFISNDKPAFDCIICGNDRIAFMVYQVLLTRGIRIPEQVGVLGFDNLAGIGELFYPPLTTVQIPLYQLGESAAMHLIQERDTRGQTRLPCHVLSRRSL